VSLLRSCCFLLVSSCSASEHASGSSEATVPPPLLQESAEPRSALSAAVDAIHPSNTKLADSVAIVAASRDAGARERASAKLIEIAVYVSSPAWLEEVLPRVQKANRDAELAPDDMQLAEQLKLYSAEEHARLIALMDQLGGPGVVAHCVTVATTKKNLLVLREAAVALLSHHAPEHPQLDSLRAEQAAERAALPPVSNAGQIVASMRKDFKLCWDAQLSQPNAIREVKGKLTAKLGADGHVVSITNSGFGSAALERCLERVVTQGKFDAPAGGGATIVIPLSFLPPDTPRP